MKTQKVFHHKLCQQCILKFAKARATGTYYPIAQPAYVPSFLYPIPALEQDLETII